MGILRKWWFWGLAVVLIAAAAGVTYRLWPRKYKLTVSPETTVLLGPLNPDGTVNYVAALNQMYGEGVTAENNAAVLLIQATGPDCLRPATRQRILEHLGIESLPASGNYFVDLEKFAPGLHAGMPFTDAWREGLDEWVPKELEEARSRPWSSEDHPMIMGWLAVNAKPLSLVVAAARRPRYHIPLISKNSPPDVGSSTCASLGLSPMARALAARAMLSAGEGGIDDAISDLLAAHRLARLVGQGPVIWSRRDGLVVEEAACRASSALATSGRLTAAQARGFLRSLEALPPLPSIAEAVDKHHRFEGLDTVAGLARRSWGRDPDDWGWTGADSLCNRCEVNVDWDQMLRKVNYWYDRQVTAMRKEPYFERQLATATCQIELLAYGELPAGGRQRGRFAERFGADSGPTWADAVREDPIRAVVSIIVPILVRCRLFHDKAVTHFRFTKVAVALAAYKAEKGRFPEKLGELEPEYLKKLPQDLFGEGPLTYRRVGKGYLLYSVGENMRDDGGKSGESGADDIAVRAE